MKMVMQEYGDVISFRPEVTRLDASQAVQFKDELLQQIDNGSIRFLLNLSDVTFIDSSGLGAIISALRRVGVKGDVKLCCVVEQVMEMLRLTRLDTVLEVFDSEEEGIASF
ncbi:anti-sigma factor antagonist [Pseudodesulfovibrio sp. JC047]|uniref:STAS domain-containing protein n=1 Tax=Pseudodesulfovibrio sp. JC047 TaxID=2683199 RepID=UPI0013D51564|nr:STAS domain-containing protein [Pseudodesulfovibrio sp. JC047]NDV19265.1 anti-sigma factor antagonist [Pseudodesulfovibrio sp. JC047]